MTEHRVNPPICSTCGYVAAASDPICIECGRVQRMLVAWCLMRAAEIGPPKSRKLVCRAASARPAIGRQVAQQERGLQKLLAVAVNSRALN